MPASDATTRFSSRVDNYVKYRPSYPATVVDILRAECGLTAEWTLADIGSGPGNLTRLFLDHGNRVYGVEPNREMREAGEALLRDYANFTSVAGTAEATTLPDSSIDLVVAGQAFHWFDRGAARMEFQRILREPRHVALIWNERRIDGTPFLRAYEQLLLDFGTDYETVRHTDSVDGLALAEFFSPHGFKVASFDNAQLLTFEGLRGRLLSSSYMPEAGHPRYQALLDAIRTLFDAHQQDGTVSLDYDTRVYYGRL